MSNCFMMTSLDFSTGLDENYCNFGIRFISPLFIFIRCQDQGTLSGL
jgi:hypothetical protein